MNASTDSLCQCPVSRTVHDTSMVMPDKNTGKSSNHPGDGIRNVKTTNVFRAVNFELYAKPNKVVMVLGSAALAGCLGYILYMRSQADLKNNYLAESEDGQLHITPKRSKWDM
ncbi:small integral membrane protein 8-like [Pollicipes pollicipes]|uniref:small integral membrane protein 8-like n=1 Tax=Pollicipes pollicipes TaxID=41117 RepID=UPI001884D5EF|nr:small integral membrane protein 8-like [Pollicipes pollicipes]